MRVTDTTAPRAPRESAFGSTSRRPAPGRGDAGATATDGAPATPTLARRAERRARPRSQYGSLTPTLASQRIVERSRRRRPRRPSRCRRVQRSGAEPLDHPRRRRGGQRDQREQRQHAHRDVRALDDVGPHPRASRRRESRTIHTLKCRRHVREGEETEQPPQRDRPRARPNTMRSGVIASEGEQDPERPVAERVGDEADGIGAAGRRSTPGTPGSPAARDTRPTPRSSARSAPYATSRGRSRRDISRISSGPSRCTARRPGPRSR